MKFDKAREFARELSLRKNRDKIITSTYDPHAKKRASKTDNKLSKLITRDQKKEIPIIAEKAKSSSDVAQTVKRFPDISERSKSSLDIARSQQKLADNLQKIKSITDVKPTTKLSDGTIVGAVQVEKPHTRIVYDTRAMRLANFKIKAIAPLERLLEKLRHILFRRTRNVKINTDKYWYRQTGEFKDSYQKAVASKTFIVKGRPRKLRFPNPVPKVVLFSLRYPSPYPYIYHRVIHKYAEEDKDENKESEKNKEGKEEE